MLARQISLTVAIGTLLFSSACTVPITSSRTSDWRPVPLAGVSGLAQAGDERWIAISDAKREGEARAALVQQPAKGIVQTHALHWSGSEPIDAEAISRLPGTADRFVVVTSKGEWFVVRLVDGTVRVMKRGTLPGQNAIKELEGFNLTQIGDKHVAVWGNRGSDKEPGRLFWSTYEAKQDRLSFGTVQSAEIRLPWPKKHVRHMSDLRLDSDGRLLVSSASDPGDEGPFASAVWEAGKFEIIGNSPAWRPLAEPIQLFRSGPDGHKIEAISSDASGRLVVGSDDEAQGSAIRLPAN
ncbi:hypothetical protein ACXR0O_29050 [Verrucomicrobiota bacterium sgz303538]